MDEKEDKVMQLLDDLKEKYGQFLDDTASEAGDGSGLHFDLTSGNIINGDEIYIEAFYLKPEAQGKGIGKKMVNAIKKLSDEIDVPITLLDKTLESPYGSSFWKSMDFDIDDDTATALYNYGGDPSSTRFARESFQLAPDDIDTPTNPVNNLEDDVAEVNNDFVYKKFAEKQNTADNVIFKELDDGTVELLVIKRKRGPHRSLFALPGGIVDYEMSNEQIIKGVIDPSNIRTMDYHDYVGDVPITPGSLKGYNGDEIFAEEAIREAFEEVGLNKKFIKNSFILPIKFNRLDWDARAAQGVNVGGVGIVVSNEWVPKAGDDALSYEWIKLGDVISGEKQLAFGHVEFVKDALYKSLKNELFEKSNQAKISKGIAIYDYEDITELDNRIYETSKRNVEIIKASNEVRTKMGEPLIPIEGNNLVDRKNQAMIDSIRGLKSYTSNSKEAIKFTAQTQMKPDFIFIDLMSELAENSLYMLDIDINDIVEKDNVLNTLEQKNAIMGNNPYSLTQDIKVTDTAKNKFKTNIKEYLKDIYRSKLQSKVNQGMMIGPYIAAMANNVDKIVNSKDFDTILNSLLDSSLSIEVDPTGEAISVIEWGDTELADYIRLDERNTNIERSGIEATVSENIEFAKNNYGDDIGQALNNIRDRNTKFFEKTFPPEIYIPSWDYYKDNAASMPEAMLETQKLKLTGDNRLQGMVYHGSPGLNAKGRAVMDIFNKYLFNNNLNPAQQPIDVMQDLKRRNKRREFANSMEGLLNKISYENNIDWLDPTKYRGRQLRLNYMYSTSNPFVAASYSMGGHNAGTLNLMNLNANQAFNAMLNHVDVLDPEDVDTLNKLKVELEKFDIIIQEGNTGQLTIRNKNTELPTRLVNPGIMQIQFDVPANAIMHTDMPLTRQLDNPNVQTLLTKIVDNMDPDIIFDEETLERLIFNLIDSLDKYDLDYDDATQQRIANLLIEATDEGTAARQTIKDYYIANIGNKQQFVKNDIAQIVKEGTRTFSDLQGLIASNLYARESISNEGLIDAINYLTRFNLASPTFFVDNRQTAGHVLFTKLLSDKFATSSKIGTTEIANFINGLDVNLLGGSYSATKDLEYVKRFLQVVPVTSDIFDDFIKYRMSQQGVGVNTYSKSTSVLPKYNVDAFAVTDDILQDLATDAKEYVKIHNLRINSKFGTNMQEELQPLLENFENEIDDIVFKNTSNPQGDRTLINFLNRANALPQKYVQAVGQPHAYADILLLKSLSQSGVEIVAGTGGGRVANDYHDVFGIVDPGDKFGTGVPRQALYTVRGVELDEEAIEYLNEVISGNKSFNDLSDKEIKAIAAFIPIQDIQKNETLSQETKDRYAKLYKDLDIYDERFVLGNIDPKPVDGAFLQQFDEFRNLIDKQSIHGNVDSQEVQQHVAKMMNVLDGQVDPENVTKIIQSSGLLKTFADGLDVFDVLVLAPVMVDILMSKITGVGSATPTIGGAVADVAQDIYDPTKKDTVFEALYGSPEDPGTWAGRASESISIIGDFYVNPLIEAAQNNSIIQYMFDGIKEGAITALTNVKDGLGMNDWLYNVKRDMYVTSVLKEKGYVEGRKIPPSLVKKLEHEYESALPKTTDKYGQPLDVSDTSNFPSYSPGRR